MLALKCKIKLDLNQIIKLETLSNEHRLLYNFLLGSIRNKSLTFKELNELYKNKRIKENLTINSKSAQNTCISLTNNIKSFYELKKKDVTAKFPYKFIGHKYFKSFTHDYNKGMGGFKIMNNLLSLNLLNKQQLNINLPEYCSKINNENIKTITFKKENNEYFIIFVYGETPSNIKLDKKSFLSIDLGYSNIATTYSPTINNMSIKSLRLKNINKQIELVQSLKDKKKVGSRKHKHLSKTLRRLKSKISNKVKDFQHKVSNHIINTCIKNNIGSLIVGDIKVKKVIRKDNKKLNGLSKSTISLGRFKTFLEYKAKKVNMDFYKVNESYTSQQNCLTDEIMFSSDLSNREMEISKGLIIDRDLNSAINIAKKVKGVWFTHDLNLSLNEIYYDIKCCNMKNV
jgi:putative transposase